ncbi:MAG: hypothetical protein ACOYOU_03680 [Kiritimatiellia bacterium]
MSGWRHGTASVAREVLVWALVALFSGCEKSVFTYRTDELLAVDPGLLSHREIAAWQVPVPVPAFLAVRPDGTVVVVGGRQGAIVDTNGVVQSRFEWQGQAATAVAAGPDDWIAVGAGNRLLAGVAAKPLTDWDSLGESAQITGLAADTNQVWVCDAAQRVVWRFDHEGRLLGQLPPPGAPREQAFVVPSPSFAVAVAADGGFWVVNPGRFQVQRHAPDGRLRDIWSKPGMKTPGFSGCCNPAFLALLPNGDLVTSEKKIPRVKIYGPDGTFRSVVAPPSALPGDEGRPVAVDRVGRVLVLDGQRIRVFDRILAR